MRIALGTRFYEEGADPEKLRRAEVFLRHIPEEIGLIFVVINDAADNAGASNYLKNLRLPRTEVFSMNVWGKFTPALNTIVYNAALREYSHLLLCSVEISLTREILQALTARMDEETLVVGAALEGHELGEGAVEGNGATVPWNTLALWNLRYLARTGFLLAGDAPFDPASAGVEELATCAVLQALYPRLCAKLIEVHDIEWHIGKLGLKRIMAHARKIKSKKERAEKQLRFLELKPPTVLHFPENK